MYRIAGFKKRDPVVRWNLPDRIFFACGACHILAFAFLETFADPSYKAVWVKPAEGYWGNHVFIDGGDWVFDYHGYSDGDAFLKHTWRKADHWWPGWTATLVDLPPDVLVSEEKSKTYDGLWLREPGQFLHDAIPRAHAYLKRFPPPPL